MWISFSLATVHIHEVLFEGRYNKVLHKIITEGIKNIKDGEVTD